MSQKNDWKWEIGFLRKRESTIVLAFQSTLWHVCWCGTSALYFVLIKILVTIRTTCGLVFKANPQAESKLERTRTEFLAGEQVWRNFGEGKRYCYVSLGPDVVSRDDKRERLAIRSYAGKYTRAHTGTWRICGRVSGDSEKSHARRHNGRLCRV